MKNKNMIVMTFLCLITITTPYEPIAMTVLLTFSPSMIMLAVHKLPYQQVMSHPIVQFHR